MKVKCLTPGGLYCVDGTTDNGEIDCDRSTEISRRHSTEISGRPERLKVGSFLLVWSYCTCIGETSIGFRNEMNSVNKFLGDVLI